VASWESSKRSKYYFDNMFGCILLSFWVNIGWVSIFAFGFILKPQPLWRPQYVVPIAGMMLGNCINGVSLALNSLLTNLKEHGAVEVELLLSLGATVYEATVQLLAEAVRTGAMPLVNSMRVVGIVSLPGMMTGQILGGSPVLEAAKYQILILYLIATCAFGTILSELWMARRACCDLTQQRLCTERLILRTTGGGGNDDGVVGGGGGKTDQNGGVWGLLARCCGACCWWSTGKLTEEPAEANGLLPMLTQQPTILRDEEANGTQQLLSDSYKYGATNSTASSTRSDDDSSSSMSDRIKLIFMRRGSTVASPVPTLELRRISRSFRGHKDNRKETFLFQNVSLSVNAGDVVAVSGASGAGKSQLLRVIAGLSPLHNENDTSTFDSSDILLEGQSRRTFASQVDWRRQVRYVSQYKVDIAGTPRAFIKRIATLASWKRIRNGDMPPSFEEMVHSVSRYVSGWGLDVNSCMDQEWKTLSGGESQRVYVAICLASKPKVLLMDESTSSLDSVSKQQVEQSVLDVASRDGVSVLWITHDADQISRMTRT